MEMQTWQVCKNIHEGHTFVVQIYRKICHCNSCLESQGVPSEAKHRFGEHFGQIFLFVSHNANKFFLAS